MRVFLDANVLFSASNPESSFARLVAVALLRSDAVMTSDLACSEARRNIVLKRPDWLPTFDALLEQERAAVGSSVRIVSSAYFDLPIELADKDVPLLCSAIAARVDYFVTGDQRDFGHLFDRSVHGVEVIRPRRLAELLSDLGHGGDGAP